MKKQKILILLICIIPLILAIFCLISISKGYNKPDNISLDLDDSLTQNIDKNQLEQKITSLLASKKNFNFSPDYKETISINSNVLVQLVFSNIEDYIDTDNIIAESGIIQKGSSTTLTYKSPKNFKILSKFNPGKQTMGIENAPHDGYLAIFPQYKLTHFDIYLNIDNNSIKIGSGTIKEEQNLVARFIETNESK